MCHQLIQPNPFQTLLDPDNGHVKEDGSIELMVIILAKDYASDDGSDEYDDDGWD